MALGKRLCCLTVHSKEKLARLFYAEGYNKNGWAFGKIGIYVYIDCT